MASLPGYGLRLAAVRVQDFRSLRDVAIELSLATTVLVGENNSGKTALLEALDVAFGKRQSRVEDLHLAPSGRAPNFVIDLRIEPTIAGQDFSDGVLDAVGDGIQLDDPATQYFTIRATGQPTGTGWEISLSRKFAKGWSPDRTAASTLTTLSSPPVGRAVLDLLHFDVLDAKRDIVDQLRNRRTFWGRTASNIEIDAATRVSLETQLKQLGGDLTANSPVLSQVRDDLRDLSDGLSAGNLSVDLEALPRSVDDLIRSMDVVLTANGSAPFPVDRHGMGTRSLAALLVFRSYVNVVRGKHKPEQQLSIAAFEEPEAHLHPQSQRAVFEILGQIGGQKIVSTHSTHVATSCDLNAYRLFRRSGAETRVSSLPGKATSSWDRELVRRFVQLENPEILFSKAVGIIEGETEGTSFPVFARALWGPRGCDAKGISLVYTRGAGNAKHIVPFLESLGIPWRIFCDGDPAGQNGLAAIATMLGRNLDATAMEVVMIPNGRSFEDYILEAGYLSQACAAADRHPKGPLAQYMKVNQNNKRSDQTVRDYTGPNGTYIGCLDFLKRYKGTVGALLAEEIGSFVPALVNDFFARLDAARA